MKATKLTVKNIGLIEDAEIEFNKPLLLFYGEVQQGKTTLLNAVKWVFGGAYPSDIIRNGESEASIRLGLDCGAITREWYRARDGSTKARPVVFEQNGIAVQNPVAEIKKFLNPFLLDQDYLRNMSELERKKYFAATFAVDTSELDNSIAVREARAQGLRSKLKGYGDIDLTPVDMPEDIEALKTRRSGILMSFQSRQKAILGDMALRRDNHEAACREVNLYNSAARENNFQVDKQTKDVMNLHAEIAMLESKLIGLKQDFDAKQSWLANHDKVLEQPLPPAPDMADLQAKLSEQPDLAPIDAMIGKVAADEVRFNQYRQNQARAAARQTDEKEIETLNAEIKELRNNKIAKLKQCSDSTGIAGLEFDEAGNFRFEGSEAGMLSTSQIMRLSSLLSAKYPPGFGVDLIDRAESLGKSILDFVTRAQQENKTILAAIVGEKPAEAPAEVGVFVVEKGVVK